MSGREHEHRARGGGRPWRGRPGAGDTGAGGRPPTDAAACGSPRGGGVAVALLVVAAMILTAGCEPSGARGGAPDAPDRGVAAEASAAGAPQQDGPALATREPTAGQTGATDAVDAPAVQAGSPAVGVQTHVLWDDQEDAGRHATLDLIARSNVGWVRMDLGWCSVEEQRGQLSRWTLDRADRMVDVARARGLQVLMTLWCTPAWASDDGAVNSPPRDPAEYGRIAGRLARHFRGRVAAWEVWNEPNAEQFWQTADPATYVTLLRAAYPALKAGDPDATVVFGGVSYNDASWIERAYAAGAAGAFDALGVHPYMGIADRPPETPFDGDFRTFRGVEAVREVMLTHGEDKPVWFTEFGWSVNPNRDDAAGWERGVTPEQQADYLVRAIELVEREYPYVSHMFWYNDRATAVGDERLNGYGLLTSDLEPRPAYVALQRYLATR